MSNIENLGIVVSCNKAIVDKAIVDEAIVDEVIVDESAKHVENLGNVFLCNEEVTTTGAKETKQKKQNSKKQIYVPDDSTTAGLFLPRAKRNRPAKSLDPIVCAQKQIKENAKVNAKAIVAEVNSKNASTILIARELCFYLFVCNIGVKGIEETALHYDQSSR